MHADNASTDCLHAALLAPAWPPGTVCLQLSCASTGATAAAAAAATLQMGIPLASTSGATVGISAAAAVAAVRDVAAADAAVLALRQATAAGLLLVSAQVRLLVEAFAVSCQLLAHATSTCCCVVLGCTVCLAFSFGKCLASCLPSNRQESFC